jgi:hypothetical protein
VKYKLTASGPYTFLTEFGAVAIGQAMISAGYTPTGVRDWLFGGHLTGQVIRYQTAKSTCSTFVTIPGGTGNDDCLVLPTAYFYNKPPKNGGVLFGQTAAVVALTNGVIVLVSIGATGPVLLTLPTLPAQATGGAAQLGDWLYVTAGQVMYGIRPGVDTAWITAYTTGDAALIGAATAGAFIYASAKTTATSVQLRVRKFALQSNSTGALTLVQSAGNDSLMLLQTTAPSSFYGPVGAAGGLYLIYTGTNGVTVAGFEGAAGTAGQRTLFRGVPQLTGGVSWTIIADLTAQYGSSSSISLGPMVVDPQGTLYTYGRFNVTDFAVLRSGVFGVISAPVGSFNVENIFSQTLSAEVQYPLLPV